MKLKPFALPNVGKSGSVLNTSTLSVEFLRRLESYATAQGITINGYGYRSIADQAAAWLRYKQDPVRNNLTAEAGKSWHGVGCAYDVNRIGNDADGTGRYPATMEADYLVAPAQQQLAKWGLCIPMWKGANAHENWHVQPIETLMSSGANSQWFLDEDDLLNTQSGYRILKEIVIPNWTYPIVYMKGSDVKRFQRAVGLPEDGWFGQDCTVELMKLQTANGLTPDGMLGNQGWAIIENILTVTAPPAPDYKALYEKATADLANEKILTDKLTAEINAVSNQLVARSNELNKANVDLDTAKKDLAYAIADGDNWEQLDKAKRLELFAVANAFDTLKAVSEKYV